MPQGGLNSGNALSIKVDTPMSHRFQKDMILEILRQAAFGTPLRELHRQYGFSEPSFYYWRAKFGRDLSDGSRAHLNLETENRRLKILLAEVACTSAMYQRAVVKPACRTCTWS